MLSNHKKFSITRAMSKDNCKDVSEKTFFKFNYCITLVPPCSNLLNKVLGYFKRNNNYIYA